MITSTGGWPSLVYVGGAAVNPVFSLAAPAQQPRPAQLAPPPMTDDGSSFWWVLGHRYVVTLLLSLTAGLAWLARGWFETGRNRLYSALLAFVVGAWSVAYFRLGPDLLFSMPARAPKSGAPQGAISQPGAGVGLSDDGSDDDDASMATGDSKASSAVSSPGKQDEALKLLQEELDDLRSQLKEARSPARPSGLPSLNAEAEPFRPESLRPGPQLSALCDFAQATQPACRISHTAARMDQEQSARLDGLPPRTVAMSEALCSGTGDVPQSSASGVRFGLPPEAPPDLAWKPLQPQGVARTQAQARSILNSLNTWEG